MEHPNRFSNRNEQVRFSVSYPALVINLLISLCLKIPICLFPSLPGWIVAQSTFSCKWINWKGVNQCAASVWKYTGEWCFSRRCLFNSQPKEPNRVSRVWFSRILRYADRNKRMFFFYLVWYILKQLFISVSVKEGLNWVMTFTAKGLKFWLFYTASSDAKWPINDGKHFKVNFWYD